MSTRDAETLAQLVADAAGTDRPLTFAQLSARSIDPKSQYKPSPNLLWRIASGEDVKVSPRLVGAIAAGLGLPLQRVRAAATRQFIGWEAADIPAADLDPEQDEVLQAARETGVEPRDMPAVRAFFEHLRRERERPAD